MSVVITVLVVVAIIGLRQMVSSRAVPTEVKYVDRIEKVGVLLELLKKQESESSLISIQGSAPAEFFEIRYVENEFRIEYQLVEVFQLENESRFAASVKQAGLVVDHWGDGLDGWDKYAFARLGAVAVDAAELIFRILKGFSGLTPETSVSIRLQDFTSKADIKLANNSFESDALKTTRNSS